MLYSENTAGIRLAHIISASRELLLFFPSSFLPSFFFPPHSAVRSPADFNSASVDLGVNTKRESPGADPPTHATCVSEGFRYE